MHYLSGGCPDIVVVIADLDQAGSRPHAIHIVVQAVVLCYDAILYFRIFWFLRLRLGQDHFAIIRELILTSFYRQTVCLCNPVGSAMHYLSGGGSDIVVVIADPDQARAGQDAILIVVQAAVFLHDAILLVCFLRENDLARLIELIDSLVQQAVGLSNPVALTTDESA